ncbi:MAG: hypothetical protein FJ276_22435 [Planctomycetes bacterium]|nr:hypothetical protein [Planctomycetota bacterium]
MGDLLGIPVAEPAADGTWLEPNVSRAEPAVPVLDTTNFPSHDTRRFPFSSFHAGGSIMRRAATIVSVIGLCVGLAGFALANGEDGGKAKYTIKEVMKEAHGSKLLNKVIGGEASSEEKMKLLDIYVALLENKPAKGEEAGWQAKANAVVAATAKAVVGRGGAEVALKEATNCAACHKEHK